MDKTPKERIVFDEGVYYGDEGSEISIEDITSREGEKGNESAKTSPVSLKTAAEEAHAVSTMLSKKNGGTDEQDGKDDLQRHMIPSEMRIPSQNDHHRAPSLSDIAAETRAASAAMETNIASRIDRERDAR